MDWKKKSSKKKVQRLRPESWLKNPPSRRRRRRKCERWFWCGAPDGFLVEIQMEQLFRSNVYWWRFPYKMHFFGMFGVRTWLSLGQSQLPWERKFARSSCFHNHVSPPRISSKVSVRKLAEVRLNGTVPPTIIWGRNWIMSTSIDKSLFILGRLRETRRLDSSGFTNPAHWMMQRKPSDWQIPGWGERSCAGHDLDLASYDKKRTTPIIQRTYKPMFLMFLIKRWCSWSLNIKVMMTMFCSPITNEPTLWDDSTS